MTIIIITRADIKNMKGTPLVSASTLEYTSCHGETPVGLYIIVITVATIV
jgi:hypothetical protein